MTSAVRQATRLREPEQRRRSREMKPSAQELKRPLPRKLSLGPKESYPMLEGESTRHRVMPKGRKPMRILLVQKPSALGSRLPRPKWIRMTCNRDSTLPSQLFWKRDVKPEG